MWMIIGIFFLMLLIGVPVAFGVGISSMLYLALNGKDLVILTQRIFAGGDSFTLMAIPLFIFAGEIMNACGVTKRIVGFANELVGFIPGGLAHVNILASMLFAGVSGSTSADVASIGGMLIGSMDEAGFDRDYATAVTAASATIGSIIPPSILMVLYSSITGISVGKLFMAGVIPGILVGVSQMIYAFIKAKKNPAKYDGDVKVKFDFKRMVKSFINALPALVMPLIIIGGILSGVFTATEAGAIAGAYGLIIGIFVYKEFTFEGAIKTVLSAARTSGMTMLIVASTTAFGYCLAIEKFPEQVSALLTGISTNANGRSDAAQNEGEHHDHAEVDAVDAGSCGDGVEDGHHDDGGRGGIHEHADDAHGNDHQEHQDVGVVEMPVSRAYTCSRKCGRSSFCSSRSCSQLLTARLSA